MSNSIKISPQHGVNPCIPICFFCGESKNEIALFGQIGDRRKGEDIKTPPSAILDYEPCDKCKELMATGITMIGVTSQPTINGQPTFVPNAYPTGSWCVVSDDFIKHNITDKTMIDAILKHRQCIADDKIVQDIIQHSNTQQNS